MSIAPGNRGQQIEVGVTLLDRFLKCSSQHFKPGQDGKLHHDPRKANVFAHDNQVFADTYGEELKITNVSEFETIKQRLLTVPTYLHVVLKKKERVLNGWHITTGKFVMYINSTNPAIQQQLKDKLDECEQSLAAGKSFALEINLGPLLKCWYKSRFKDNFHTNYTVTGSKFCITNSSKKCDLCFNPAMWIFCLPIMLVFGIPYRIFRAEHMDDLQCEVHAKVSYLEGVSQAKLRQFAAIVAEAYAHGVNAGSSRQAAQAIPPPYSAFPTNQ